MGAPQAVVPILGPVMVVLMEAVAQVVPILGRRMVVHQEAHRLGATPAVLQVALPPLSGP